MLATLLGTVSAAAIRQRGGRYLDCEDRQDLYQVAIRTMSDGVPYNEVTCTDEDLSLALSRAVIHSEHGRLSQLLSEISCILVSQIGDDGFQPFPEYQETLSRLVNAAEDMISHWEEFDKQNDEEDLDTISNN